MNRRPLHRLPVNLQTKARFCRRIHGAVRIGIVGWGRSQYILNFLFLGGADPRCIASADANADGSVNLPDGQYILNFLFLGGADPKTPGFPVCEVSALQSDIDQTCLNPATAGARQ